MQHIDPEDVGANLGKVKLQPRRPGESVKVAETVLKRRDRNLQAAAQRAATVAKVRRNQKEYKKGKLKIIRAEKLVKNARIRKVDSRRLLNGKKKKLPGAPRGRILAVVRNGRLGGMKEVKQTLKKLGINQRHTLVFMPNNEETVRSLSTCKPFLFWGRPSFKTVFNVVHKKVMFRDPDGLHGRTMLSDNTLIEKHLGDLGVLCTEDLAHTVHTNGKGFKEVVSRLWPVPLGDNKKANGLVHDKKFTYGDLSGAIDLKIKALLGE